MTNCIIPKHPDYASGEKKSKILYSAISIGRNLLIKHMLPEIFSSRLRTYIAAAGFRLIPTSTRVREGPTNLERFLEPITGLQTPCVIQHVQSLHAFIESIPVEDTYGTNHHERRLARADLVRIVPQFSEINQRNPLRGNNLAAVSWSLGFLHQIFESRAVEPELRRLYEQLDDLLSGRRTGVRYQDLTDPQKLLVMAAFKQVAHEVLELFTGRS